MPKVSEEYLSEKKNFIVECTNEILKEKPLYQITMRDIIKKAGFSQGVIYRYYASIDEVYIDLINKNTNDSSLKERIDELLSSKKAEKEILFESIIAIGEYIDELLNSVGGKTFYELIVHYGYDYEKRSTVFPKLKLKQSLEHAQMKLVEYFVDCIKVGKLHSSIPVERLIKFISTSVDGISQIGAMSKVENNNQDKALDIDISEMFQTLAEATVNFLSE